MGKGSRDYVQVTDTFECEQDQDLSNVTLARDKKLSVLDCQNRDLKQNHIKIVAQFSAN